MVSTLVQMSNIVGDSIALEHGPFWVHNKRFADLPSVVGGERPGGRVSGKHPLVAAFDICEEFDPLFSYNGLDLVACSFATLNVLFQIVKKDRTFWYPKWSSVVRLIPKFPVSWASDRMRRFVALGESGLDESGLIDGDLFRAMMLAGKLGRWDVVRSMAAQHSALDIAFHVYSELGNLESLREEVQHLSPAQKTTQVSCTRRSRARLLLVA